ncbi:hypothetical protein BC833DRAFT_592285 [Globomyces pollinis-pini]|nr:hypothetical protein BC833DRAFT_592285 [Globomyces pollinis-pini]
MVKYINLGANLLQLNAKEQYPLHLWLRMITNTEMKITKKHVGILKSFFPKGCENQLQIKLLNHSDLRGNSALSVSLTYDIWYQAVNRDYFTKKPDRYSFHGQYIELSPISKYLLQRGCKLKPNKGNMTVFHEFASIMFGDHIIPGFKVNDPDDLETINHIYLDVPLVLVILKTFKVIGKLDLNWRRDSDNFTGYDVIVDRYHSHNIDLNEIEYTRLIEGLGHLGCKSFKVQTSKKRSRRQFESQ